MMKTKKNTQTKPKEETPSMEGSIDQIREILFGTAQREHKKRASRIEKDLEQVSKQAAQHLQATEKAIQKRMDTIASDLVARLDALAARLDEVEARARSDNTAVEKDLSEKISESENGLRQDVDDLGHAITKKLHDLHQELGDAIDRLDHQKTTRDDLGDYLMDVATRLKGDSALPPTKKNQLKNPKNQ